MNRLAWWTARLAIATLLVVGGATTVTGQARLSDTDAAKPSPLAPLLERLDDELRQDVTSGDDAASRWMSGQFAPLEPVAQAQDFAAASARAPAEMLYVASLARACLARIQPTPAACDNRDAIAYWAARDPDNAAPWLLLAERARQRRTADVVEYLERAARAARFDDYSERSTALYAARLARLPGGQNRAAVAVAAARYADRAAGHFGPVIESLCGPRTAPASERVRQDCLRIAALLIEKAPNGVDRATGIALAAALAPSQSGRAIAETRGREIAVQRQRCAETWASVATIAANPSDPAGSRAAVASQAWLADRATMDELAACDRLAAALAVRR